MGGPIADVRVWDGSSWVQRQQIGSDGQMASIYPMRVSPDGLTWWPEIATGETAPSAPTSFSAVAASKSQINLSWAAPATPGDFSEYWLYRDGSKILTTTGTSYNDTGLSSSTSYSYSLYGATPGGKVGPSATASATTQAGTQQKVVTLTATSSASYNAAGANRGVSEIYCGYYSSTHGQQKSQWIFSLPGDLANCVSIDKVEISVYCQHHYYNSGGKFGVVVHHNSVVSGSYGGSTSIFNEYAVPKPGWLGNTQWLNVTNYTCPGRYTVKEEFRKYGAKGFGLAAPSTSLTYYGYGQGATQTNKPQVRFTYTISI